MRIYNIAIFIAPLIDYFIATQKNIFISLL